MRRGAFIGKCLEVQEAFSFAALAEVLGAIKLYCGDFYGGPAGQAGQPRGHQADELLGDGSEGRVGEGVRQVAGQWPQLLLK